MNTKESTPGMIAVLKKTASVFLGLILSLLILEMGLRLGGFALSFLQERDNLESIKQKGTYRILCLGESTTQRQYPQLLEQVLNQRHIGVRFSVIDKGRAGTNSPAILSRVESYLALYHPDMVIAMMGNNDRGITYYKDISESLTWIFQHCRVYRFGRILCMQLLKKIRKKDIDDSSGADLGKKSKPDDPGIVVPRSGLPSGSIANTTPDLNHDKDYVKLGRLYQEKGELSRAEDFFKKAVEINPEDDNACVELGLFYRFQDNLPQAENMFKKAIAINPKNDKASVELGWLYGDQGKLAEAYDLFVKARGLNPENDVIRYSAGKSYRRQGKLLQAEEAYKKAIELDPADELSFLELGQLYREQGKLAQAEALFQKALGTHFEKGPERTLRVMASLYDEMGKPELAKNFAEKARQASLGDNAAMTVSSYRKLKGILDDKGVKLVCVQYPMRSVEPLKRIFENDKSVIFVDNERIFREAVRKESYKEYFRDMFAGDFGHCTQKGNTLLAQNIADVILGEVFNKESSGAS